MRTIDNINNLNKADFLLIFGNVFEKTESVALEAFKSKPFKDFDDIILKMLNIYESYPKDKILENPDSNDNKDSALGAMGLKPKIVH